MSARPHSIRSAEYDASAKRLVVRFLVGAYTYRDVPEERGAALVRMSGDELREAFDSGIEGKYKSERTGE